MSRNTRYAKRAIYAMEKILGQYFELVLVFIRKLHPLGLTALQIDALMKKEHPFWLAFERCLETLRMPSDIPVGWTPEAYAKAVKQVDWWKQAYAAEGIMLDVSDIFSHIPLPQDGWNWLVIVPKGIRINQIWSILKKHFKCWSPDRDLESEIQESERGEVKKTSVRWFRDRVEADKEMKNLSANILDDQLRGFKGKGITLLERLLLGFMYFLTTGKHLDIENWTLCNGSRLSGGIVPRAGWHGGGFCVGWTDLDDRTDSLRSRVAVG